MGFKNEFSLKLIFKPVKRVSISLVEMACNTHLATNVLENTISKSTNQIGKIPFTILLESYDGGSLHP